MLLPDSTYRIQLHSGFTFHQLESILDYLHELGISTVYASPITKAIKGSQHGYDATDPLAINPEIGSEQDLERLSGLLKKYGMHWLQDIVPNHMAYTSSNPWLYDVLERGKQSEYYSFFDIDTDPSGELTGEKIMAPFLGSTLTECLQKGELVLDFTDQGFVIRYFENFYPVAITFYHWIATLAEGCPTGLLASILELEDAVGSSAAEWKDARQKRWKRLAASEEYCAFIRQRVSFINQRPAVIAELVQGQHYILTHAHLAASRINYRRFFTVNSLICLRMEGEKVFTAYHAQIHSWYCKGYIQGLRLDHIDGLAAPREYIHRLREKFGTDCYIVAEKILEEGEPLPDNWELEGTTGYEFLSAVSQVLTDPEGSRKLLVFYKEQIAGTERIAGTPAATDGANSYDDLVFEKKHHFLITYMGGELDNLLHLLYSLPLLGASGQDKVRMKEALAILMASFPVYRIYPDAVPFPPASRMILSKAFALAREKAPAVSGELGFLEGIFGEDEINVSDQRLRFQTRLMQFTGPLAAKGIEDTTFYVYHPYIAHNEVGDTPSIAGITPEAFHTKMAERLATTPHSLNATSTHDTKRGEDSRIRLNWLSSVPDEWISSVNRWREMNRFLTAGADDKPAPVPNDEYLIYQALLGGFPEDLIITDLFRERFHAYLIKALREGKTTSNWDQPDEEYEQKCHSFVTAILQPESVFLEDFTLFVNQCIRQSLIFSLSQLLIKLTAPGVPDIYQGAELWETSFVDPDNRRPIDYALRAGLLKRIKEEEAVAPAAVLNFVLANRMKGAAKLYTIYRTLAYRNDHPLVFSEGDYDPISVQGPFLAYIRRHEEQWALVVVPLIRQDTFQQETILLRLPAGAPVEWSNVFTGDIYRQMGGTADRDGQAGGVLELKDWSSRFPVALLTGRTDALSLNLSLISCI